MWTTADRELTASANIDDSAPNGHPVTGRLPGYIGLRRIGPGGLHRAGRLRELVGTGLVDSFGMSVGWTVVVLFAVARGGIAEAALYNAAMLLGVVVSAPVTGWLARRLAGRTLLRLAAAVELTLRLAVLGGLIAGEIISVTSMIDPAYAYVMLFAVMTLVLMLRPQGLLGKAGRE